MALGLSREDLRWRPKDRHLSWLFLDNTLAVNEFRVRVTTAARKLGCEIETWISDQELRSREMRDYVDLNTKRGKKRVAIVPDGYFRLVTDGDAFNFLVEIDRGTITGQSSRVVAKSWQARVAAYAECYRTELYAKRYGTANMRVLTVVPSKTRQECLVEATELAGGKRRFWFAMMEEISERCPLTDTFWTQVGSHDRVAIIS